MQIRCLDKTYYNSWLTKHNRVTYFEYGIKIMFQNVNVIVMWMQSIKIWASSISSQSPKPTFDVIKESLVFDLVLYFYFYISKTVIWTLLKNGVEKVSRLKMSSSTLKYLISNPVKKMFFKQEDISFGATPNSTFNVLIYLTVWIKLYVFLISWLDIWLERQNPNTCITLRAIFSQKVLMGKLFIF